MDEEKNYSITVKGGSKSREIHLSAGLFKFGAVSLIIAAVIFVGTCSYSVYSALHKQQNINAVNEVRKAEEIQQEQLLEISKKADAMSETLQNLTQQEQDLRIQAGLKPPKEDKLAVPSIVENPERAEEKPDGQGGPIEPLNFEDVKEALGIIEERVNIRRESLDDFQTQLKNQREKLAIAAASAGAVNVSGFAGSSITLDLSQFGGAPSANPNMPSIWPTTGVVTSPYGLRWGGTDFHPGMDIANDMGTPIVATADGIVEYAGWNSGGYGNMVDIDHGNGIMTRYGHASQVVVATGQHVRRGQVIAYMGSTGFSTGPHVHYEIHINGQRVNPISYL